MAKSIPRRALDPSIVGGSGLKQLGGFVYEDFLAQLNGLNGVKLYREMVDNDPIVGGLLTAITLLLRGVKWRVEASGETAAHLEAAEFVEGVMFEDMSHGFPDFLSEALTMLPYGFAVHEIVWKKRVGPYENDPSKRSKFTDGRVGIRKLAGRAQDSIWKWELQDDGGIAGVHQMLPYSDGHQPLLVFIPVEKMLLFRTSTIKNNPEGRSILRSAYVQYMRKQIIEAAEGRAALRTAGVATLKIPAQYMTADADSTEKAIYNTYKAIAENLAMDKQGGLLLPSDTDDKGNELFKFEFVTTGGKGSRPADMTAVVERYDKRIATTALADFLLLGQQAVGSFALSKDKTALFSASLTAYNGMVADVLNRVLLPRLWMVNAFDPDLMPKLVPGEIEGRSLDELGKFVQQMAGAGMPLFPDEELEATLREEAGLPEASGDAKSNNPIINGEPAPGEEPPTPEDEEAEPTEKVIQRAVGMALEEFVKTLETREVPRTPWYKRFLSRPVVSNGP